MMSCGDETMDCGPPEFEANVEFYRDIIVGCIQDSAVVSALAGTVIDGGDDNKLRELYIKRPSCEATGHLLDLVLQSKEPGKWKAFIDALNKADYPYIAKLLQTNHRPEQNPKNERQMIRIFSSHLEKRIDVLEMAMALYSKRVINGMDKEKICAVREQKGNECASVVLLEKMQCRQSPAEWYQAFLQALMKTGNSDIVHDMEPDFQYDQDEFEVNEEEAHKSEHNMASAYVNNTSVAIGTKVKLVELSPNCEEDRLQNVDGGNISFFPLKELGHGSNAVVYEGRFGKFHPKHVAVKVIKCINEQAARETQVEIKNIYREIETMETLNIQSKCTNIIDFIDSSISTNRVYLAFELAKGTLHDYVDSSNVSWQTALPCATVTRGIVDGLNYTHRKKIVHRDLKPANIFIVELSETGLKAVIGDYGTAKATTESMFTLTGRMGSLGYIAPEIWKAMTDTKTDSFGSICSKQSDIFSLALVIYFTLSLGKHPFGSIMTAQTVIEKASSPNFEQIRYHMNAFAYIDMLLPMLNNDPTERPKIEKVSEHPALMSADKIMEFFIEKSNEFEREISADQSQEDLLENSTFGNKKDYKVKKREKKENTIFATRN